jgi:hypothetical protein
MANPRKKLTAAAADPESPPATVRVRYTRTHYPAGAAHPKKPGDEEVVPIAEGRALRDYQIADIIEPADLDMKVVETPPPIAPASPSRTDNSLPGVARYNAGGLLIVDNPKLVQ